MNSIGLLYAIRNQIRKDSTSERDHLFSTFLRDRPAIRISFQLLRVPALHFIHTPACLAYGAFCAFGPGSYASDQILMVAGKQNERSALQELASHLQSAGIAVKIATVTSDRKLSLPCLPSIGLFVRASRLLRRFSELPLFTRFRLARTLFYYSIFSRHVQKKRPKAIVISTEGNPYGSAILGVCFQFGVPCVYLAHAPISQQAIPLKCQIAVFWGKASAQEMLEAGSRISQLIYKGQSDKFKPVTNQNISSPQKIGIFLAKDFHSENLRHLIRSLQSEQKDCNIFIRPHPDSVQKIKIGDGLPVCWSEGLEESLSKCDFVIGGNSTVHLESLLRGVASFYAPCLDNSIQDRLKLLQGDLIWKIHPDQDLWDQIQSGFKFYQESHWKTQFAKYMNISETESTYIQKLLAAIQGT